MAGEELERHLGPDVTASFRVENHDARAADLVPLGELAGHGPVRFNATVARADVKITVGSIVPHVHNGFGGGPKNVMPAICDYDTVRHHHLKNMLHPGARPGVVDGNPFLADVSQIAEFLGVDFTVQCLRDSVGHVHEVLAGEPGAVRRTGVALQTDCLGVPVGRKSDVTIVSSYPYDHGIQFLKGLMPAALVTATNGSILLVTRATAPLPTAFLDAVRAVRGSGGIEAESRLLATLARREAPIPDCAMDFNMAVILLFAIARRFRTTIVGPEALRTAAEAMDYEYCADLETALCRTKQQQPRASVQVIPAGGYVFPMTEEPFLLFGQGEPPRRPIPGKEAR
jgi:nickel-dependent lactate racemase